jgi:phosphatidylglycerol:prolipoprotein diacylglycerol transferase
VFLLAGILATAMATAIAGVLARAVGMPATVLVAMAVAAPAAFLADVVVQAAARGRVNLVAFREAGLALAAALGCSVLLGYPARPGLDVAAAALAAQLAGARLGCLAAGCCYGRPSRLGVAYTQAHVDLGFPAALVGVPLAAVPAWEAGALALLTVAGAGLASAAPAGTAFGVVVGAYSAVRAGGDGFRGDPGRPRRGAVSSVVWVAAGVGVGLLATAAVGLLPAVVGVAGCVALGVAAARIASSRSPGRARAARLLAPDHIVEFATLVTATGSGVTSAGLRVSARRVPTAEGPVPLYSLSAAPPLVSGEVKALVRLLRGLVHPHDRLQIVPGRTGVVHLVAASAPDTVG